MVGSAADDLTPVEVRPAIGDGSVTPESSVAAASSAGAAGRQFTSRPAFTVVICIVLLGAILVAALTVRSLIQDQERRLLAERTTEVGSFLSITLSGVKPELLSAGTAALTDGPTSSLFLLNAEAVTPQVGTVVVAQLRNGTFHTVAVHGARESAAAPVVGERETLAHRALAAKDLVTDVTTDPTGKRLLIAVAIPAADPTVAYLDSPLGPIQATSPPNSPYRELNVRVYDAPSAVPSQLMFGVGADPTSAKASADQLVIVGKDPWLVVTSARTPLVGTFASNLPWLLLVGGIVISALMVALIEVLRRRRTYALALVEERTSTLRDAREEADEANRSKSQFISRMSHELRTPLNAVLGFSQLLQMGELTPAQNHAVVQITRGGRHLLDLINEILDISQVDGGQLSLMPEVVPVGDVIGDAIDLLRPLADNGFIDLRSARTPVFDECVYADRQRTKQILLNLIGNGIKYNHEHGSVAISCVTSGTNRLRIQVSDTGPGIAANQIPLLFTPFERLGAERTTIEGTGMGLALSRRLAEAMGGALGVSSTLGEGSTFWVELPLAKAPLPRGDMPVAGATVDVLAAADVAGESVLHIEDNPSNQLLVEGVMQQRPAIGLMAATEGGRGLELAREYRPMLILLDLDLPDQRGEQVLRSLLEDPRTADIPVAVLTADASKQQAKHLLAAGATAYLTKPLDVKGLLRMIDEAHGARTEASIGAN